jgi:hypothetical protein
MMPRYSQDGQVCEIGLQTRHYSPEIVRLDSSLSRSEINGLFDELVPADERGRKSEAFGSEMTTMDGPGLTTIIQYENVWFEIVSERLPTSTQKVIRESDVVAIVHWKNRTCQ